MKIYSIGKFNQQFRSFQNFPQRDSLSYTVSNSLTQGDMQAQNKPPHLENSSKSKDKKIFYSVAGGVLLAASAFVYLKSFKSGTYSKEVTSVLKNQTINLFERECKLFSKDINYRQELLAVLGLKPENHLLLRSIVGPQEYHSIIRGFSASPVNYSPGAGLITDVKNNLGTLVGVENGTFRANMHMHTLHSDGKMSVLELLDQAAEYADKAVLKLKPDSPARHAPFTVAITDHDTLDGCKEAVAIIAKNPEKYKNLRVVLGCEMTVENLSIPHKLKKPVDIHLLLHAINPFDEKLNTFLLEKRHARIDLIKDIINKSKEKLPQELSHLSGVLDYEDSKGLYPILNHGLTHVYNSSKDYVQFRTMFTECFENNKLLQSELKQKGVDVSKLNYIDAKEKYFDSIPDGFGFHYWGKYQKALVKYTADLLGISESEAAQKIVVPEKMKEFFNEIEKISQDSKPKLKLSDAYIDMDGVINMMKEANYGYMGIAHPGLTSIGDSVENPQESMQAMSDLFKTFKLKGSDKALFTEGHYHYFGQVGKDKEKWLDVLKQYAQNAGLYFSGGLDSHGKSIFYG